MANINNFSIMPTHCIDGAIDYTAFSGKSWQEKMDSCNKCNCCERHSFQKPRYVLPIVYDYDYVDVLDTTKELWYKECRCKCRYLARRMCEEANFKIMASSPDPCDLPLPPQRWLKKEDDIDLNLLDSATEDALDYYWKGQVKACQYAIFHIC